MAHPYHHALSSVKKWGGTVDDYTRIHGWFDESKLIIADFRHRALRHHAEGIFMKVIWTRKPALMFASTEVVVPVVHRRGPAVRVARIDAQAERTAGRCLWTHRGEHRAVCHISYSPALRMGIIDGRDPRVAPQFGFPLWVESRHSSSLSEVAL